MKLQKWFHSYDLIRWIEENGKIRKWIENKYYISNDNFDNFPNIKQWYKYIIIYRYFICWIEHKKNEKFVCK